MNLNKFIKYPYNAQEHQAWLDEWRASLRLPALQIDADSVAFWNDSKTLHAGKWCQHAIFYKGSQVITTALIPCALVEWNQPCKS